MNKLKLILTIVLTFVVLFAQAGPAAAAPLTQTSTSIAGTVTDISFETDANNVTTVLVTLVDDQNVTQTVRIDVDTAASLGLLLLDENDQPVIDPATNLPTADDSQLNQPITIDSSTVIPDKTTEEEPVNPISSLLAAFFGEEPSIIDGYHNEGFGFGIIAQALWMSQNLGGDAALTEDILLAKQDKNFEAFFEAHPEYLEDGDTAPTNWGQFRKEVLNKKNNLGVIISGHADESDPSIQSEQGNGNGHGNEDNNGNGQNKNKNKDKGKNK